MSKMHTLRLPTVRFRLTFRSFFGLKNQTSDIEMEYGFVKKGYFFYRKRRMQKTQPPQDDKGVQSNGFRRVK